MRNLVLLVIAFHSVACSAYPEPEPEAEPPVNPEPEPEAEPEPRCSIHNTVECHVKGGQCVDNATPWACKGTMVPDGCGEDCSCCIPNPAVWPQPTYACGSVGGLCINETLGDCKGRVMFGGCEERGVCCVPECPYDEGFFSPPGSNQCFKYIQNRMNWADAENECKNMKRGIKLAHPFDAETLRSYMIQRYGQSIVWLNGQGDGTYMRWQDIVLLGSASPQWLPGNGGFPVDKGECLQMANTFQAWKNNRIELFKVDDCSAKAGVLCELVIEYP